MTRVLFVLLLGLVVAAWAVAARGVVWARPPEVLRIGTNVWTGYEPLHAARAGGRVDGRIEVVELVTANQVMRAFRYGEIDAAAITLDEALRLTRGHRDVEIVAVVDVSAGADAVVARAGIESLAALRGRRVGVEATSVGGYLLGRALTLGGLGRADITEVLLAQGEHLAAWRAGTIDAAVTFEPGLSVLRAEGAQVLLSSHELPGEIVDVLVVRRGLPVDAAVVLRDVWFAAREAALRDVDAFAVAGTRRLGIDADHIKTSLALVEFPTQADGDALLHGRLLENARAIAVELRRAGVAIDDDDVASLFEHRW